MISTAVQSPFDIDVWRRRYGYAFPDASSRSGAWRRAADGLSLVRTLPETRAELKADSRWPAFFPSSMCLVTATDGRSVALEKVVGASIVNRFPYVVALSFCREELSDRHHARRRFTSLIEKTGTVAIQFLPQGDSLDRAMNAITSTTDDETGTRIRRAGLATRPASTNDAPVFEDSYLVYEARLASPGRDGEGHEIYDPPWEDVGSHRIYFFEITGIQLQQDIANGTSQIHWRSLPVWSPQHALQHDVQERHAPDAMRGYQKPYTPFYSFPAPQTVAFESDLVSHGMAVKFLPPSAADQIEVDNDRARWPCFFPSSLGMITSWTPDQTPNLMPCGSTTIISRHPLVIAPCVSYSAINERYAPRATLNLIRHTGRFVCGVPFIHDAVLDAIRCAGNVSLASNPHKVRDAGLEVSAGERGPLMPALPVQFECEVIGEIRLGTHVMFLGEAHQIRMRMDVTPENPLQWCPWPIVEPASSGGGQ